MKIKYVSKKDKELLLRSVKSCRFDRNFDANGQVKSNQINPQLRVQRESDRCHDDVGYQDPKV
jgi:hypothetical protein